MSLEHYGAPTGRQIRPTAGFARCSSGQSDEPLHPLSPSKLWPSRLEQCTRDRPIWTPWVVRNRPNRCARIDSETRSLSCLLSFLSRFDQAALVSEDHCLHSVT
jgi:hypothetical protein